MGNYVHVPSAEVCFYASQRDCLHSFLTLPLFRLNFLPSSSCCWDSSGKSGCLSWSSPPSTRPKIQCPSDMPTVNTSCKLALSRALTFWGPDVTDTASRPPQCSMSSLPLLGKQIPNLIGKSSQTEKKVFLAFPVSQCDHVTRRWPRRYKWKGGWFPSFFFLQGKKTQGLEDTVALRRKPRWWEHRSLMGWNSSTLDC